MRIINLTALALLIMVRSVAAQACTNVGVERWPVKTMAPLTTRARQLDLADFGKLAKPKDINLPHDKMLDTRYPTPIKSALHEGDLASIAGWVQKITTSADDCDYHIEITLDKEVFDGPIIVKVPDPDAAHVPDEELRGQLRAMRTTLTRLLKLTKEQPGTTGVPIDGGAIMEFTGALFFDGPHSPACKRGARNASVS